jgi:hypothetical protein
MMLLGQSCNLIKELRTRIKLSELASNDEDQHKAARLLHFDHHLSSKEQLSVDAMHLFQSLYAGLAIASALTSPLSLACQPLAERQSSDAFVLGDDGPADPATLGYTLNHMALVVNDMEAMMHFYGKILGMRHIFTYHATPKYDIVYSK